LNPANPYEPPQSRPEEPPVVIEYDKESFSQILRGAKQWLLAFRIVFCTALVSGAVGALALTYGLGDQNLGVNSQIFIIPVVIGALPLITALGFQLLGLLNFCRVKIVTDAKFYFGSSLILFFIYWTTAIIDIGITILSNGDSSTGGGNSFPSILPLILQFLSYGIYIIYCVTSFLGLKTIGSHFNSSSIQSSSLIAMTLYVTATLLQILVQCMLMFEMPKFNLSELTPENQFTWVISGLILLSLIHYFIGLYFYSSTLKQIISRLRAA
jgi:hypothetical protein